MGEENLTYQEVSSKLIRIGKNKYQWRDDGSVAQNIEDLRLADLAPGFRVMSGNVEIPLNWKSSMKYDRDLIPTIDDLIAQHGHQTLIFAERGGSRIKTGKVDIEQPLNIGDKEVGSITEPYTIYSNSKYTNGWLIPLKEWDYAMDKVVGVKWVMTDEEMTKKLHEHR